MKFQSILRPAMTEFDHPEKGDALFGIEFAESFFISFSQHCLNFSCLLL